MRFGSQNIPQLRQSGGVVGWSVSSSLGRPCPFREINMAKFGDPSRREQLEEFDLQSLLHPASAFDHPNDVVRDPDLSLNEKRAILASWASDACAAESARALRKGKNGTTVTFDDVLDALRTLDSQADQTFGKPQPAFKRRFRRWGYSRSSGYRGGGLSLH